MCIEVRCVGRGMERPLESVAVPVNDLVEDLDEVLSIWFHPRGTADPSSSHTFPVTFAGVSSPHPVTGPKAPEFGRLAVRMNRLFCANQFGPATPLYGQ